MNENRGRTEVFANSGSTPVSCGKREQQRAADNRSNTGEYGIDQDKNDDKQVGGRDNARDALSRIIAIK